MCSIQFHAWQIFIVEKIRKKIRNLRIDITYRTIRPTKNAWDCSARDLTPKLCVKKRQSCKHSVRCVNVLLSRCEKKRPIKNAQFYVFTAVLLKIKVFTDVNAGLQENKFQRFEELWLVCEFLKCSKLGRYEFKRKISKTLAANFHTCQFTHSFPTVQMFRIKSWVIYLKMLVWL